MRAKGGGLIIALIASHCTGLCDVMRFNGCTNGERLVINLV